MRKMKKIDFLKHNNGIMCIEIIGVMPEKIINLFWKNGIEVKNVKKKNITTISMDIKLKDYKKIKKICEHRDCKLKIKRRKGLVFLFFKANRRKTFIFGILIFVYILYYLSTFIWGIDIKSEQNIAPYEIRQDLKSMGIVPGINKSKINVYDLEEKLMKCNDNIMWVKVRMDGSKLKISTAERVAPPEIQENNEPCDIVASKDGQIVRVFASSGTPVVKSGDVVKSGQLLIKREQGNEDNVYEVHAKGSVIARTFYERQKEINLEKIDKKRSGNKIKNYYILFKGKKIYLKNNLIKFDKYDKIEENRFFIKKEVYYEIVENKVKLDKQKVIDESIEELYSNININLGRDVVVVDKKNNIIPQGDDKYLIRVVLIVEEDIGMPKEN